MFGLSVKEKFAKLDKNDADAVNKLFKSVYREILTSLRMSVIGTAANRLSTEEKYELIKKYAENGEGTLRISNGKVVFAKIK